MNRTEIANDIVKSLSEDNHYNKGIILLGGDWGSGKTHLWENYIKKQLEANSYLIIYISIFGMESIQDVKRSIISQYITKRSGAKDYVSLVNNWESLKKVSSLIKPFLNSVQKYVGFDLINFQFDPLDLMNQKCIICFDDLERKSSSLELKSVLGLISYLSDNKNAKILVLSNEDELAPKHPDNFEADEYKRFSEKVISFRYKLSPDFDEFYDQIADEYKKTGTNYFIENRDTILSFFIRSKSNNLRTIEKAFRIIYRILESNINLSTTYLEILLFYVICSAEGRLTDNPKDFDFTKSIVKKKMDNKSDQLSFDENEKVNLHDRFFGNVYSYTLVTSLYVYVQSGYFDKVAIKNEIDPIVTDMTPVQKYLKLFQSEPRLYFMNDSQLNERYRQGVDCLFNNKHSISAFELANLAAHLRICKKFLNQELDIEVDKCIKEIFETKSKSGDDSFEGANRFHLGHYREFLNDYIPIYEKYLRDGVSHKLGKEILNQMSEQKYFDLLQNISTNQESYRAFVFEISSEQIADLYFSNREVGNDLLIYGFKYIFVANLKESSEYDSYRKILYQRIDQVLIDNRLEASDIYRMRAIYKNGQESLGADEKLIREKFRGITKHLLD